jgi:hypothetical protein
MGNLIGPGICLKVFALLESAKLILLEKDDMHLATVRTVQLLKFVGYITAIFTSSYYLKKKKNK